MKPGIHLAHKVVGESSFDVVRRFKRAAADEGLKHYALGHGGTLDPFAEGLLLVLAGQATRLMELMHPLPKTYLAEIAWGVETDTCDHLGKPVSEGGLAPSPEELDAVLKGFLGWQEQIPPATCAKKIDGEAAYKKAHRGEVVELRPSNVYLHEARWVSHGASASLLELTCRGGYYVRSLARDLGRRLGCGAHLSKLHRSAIGPWRDPGLDGTLLIEGEALIPWCPTRILNEEEADHLQHGRSIPVGEIYVPVWLLPQGFPNPGSPVRGVFAGRLVALLQEMDGVCRTVANLRGGL